MSTTRPSSATDAPAAPLGPGSVLWSVAGDPRSLLTGSAAGIMQLMLPGLGAGVTDHSDFFDDPLDRIFRSVPYIWGTIFAPDDAEGDRRGREIRGFHNNIKGTDDQGRSYHALDPDVYWWAHATFTWEFFRARELYWPVPLSGSQQRRLYAETVTWYRRYGVSDRAVPDTLEGFRARFEDICANTLEMTPAAEWVLDPERNSVAGGEKIRLPGPLGLLDGLATQSAADLLKTIVHGAMPDIVRRRFDVPWTDTDRVRFLGVCTTIRTLSPAVRLGFLADLFPEGTPHLDPRDPRRVIEAGPSATQRRLGTGRSPLRQMADA